jgi:hypothetical protein
MIPIVCKYLTPRGFRGLTLFPFVLVKSKKDRQDLVFLNHEKIHIRQQLELLVVPFYVLYLLEFLVRWMVLKNRFKAYKSISFEREAYGNEYDLGYLKKRKWYGFLNYF